MGGWKTFLGPTPLFQGIYVQDRITLITNGDTFVKINNFTFASGLLVDRHFFSYASFGDSMLGLAPSSSSSIPELMPFPVELHRRKLIQDPILTMAQNNDSLFFGGFDGDSCNFHTYRSAKIIEEGKWKIRLEEISVPHLEMRVINATVIFEPHFTGIGIPQIWVQRLLDSGKIVYINGKYRRPCNDTFEFKFYLQRQEYSFNWKTLPFDDDCILHGFIPMNTPYTDTNQWIFGAKVIENVCVILDYEEETIGFAKFLYNKWF
ncbi:hypothetical protein M3Y97_00693500 [Aphelenchoides bicaudatus]|nr:hypothetical protein M3Y97_00693500 [Aphelenchoides bicaudatus]